MNDWAGIKRPRVDSKRVRPADSNLPPIVTSYAQRQHLKYLEVQVFELVADVERYLEFMPWATESPCCIASADISARIAHCREWPAAMG